MFIVLSGSAWEAESAYHGRTSQLMLMMLAVRSDDGMENLAAGGVCAPSEPHAMGQL